MNDQDLESQIFETDNEKVIMGPSLGSGAEGAVFKLKHNNDHVAKIFEPDIRDSKEGKIRAMLQNAPNDPTKNETGIRSLVWPEELLFSKSAGEFVGYLMPYKNVEDHLNIRRYARKKLDWSQKPDEGVYAIGYNLVVAVKNIHNQGHALGDMNHQNIFVNDNGYVSLIDCDGFQIQGSSKTYRESLQFQRYAPPEGRGKTLQDVRLSDRFGLGVHIFQLLMHGFHPFQAKGSEAVVNNIRQMIVENEFVYGNPQPGEMEPHSAAPEYEKLPSEVRELFNNCFSGGKDIYKSSRPTPEEWERCFGKLLGKSYSPKTGGSTKPEGGKEDEGISDPLGMFGEADENTSENKSNSEKSSNSSAEADEDKRDISDPDDMF